MRGRWLVSLTLLAGRTTGSVSIDLPVRPPRPAACRPACSAPSRAGCAAGPPETASAPGGTLRRTTVPPPVEAPSPISTGATKVLLEPRAGQPADARAVLGDPVVVGEDRAGPDVGLLADLGVADVGQVRHLGAVADLGVLGLHEGADLAARRPAWCRGAGRRTVRRWPGRRSRRARRGRGRPGRRRPTSQSLSVVSGPITASSATTVAPSSCTPGRIVTSASSLTSASIQVVAGVHHGDAVAHPPGDDAAVHLLAHLGQLDAVVGALGLHHVVDAGTRRR